MTQTAPKPETSAPAGAWGAAHERRLHGWALTSVLGGLLLTGTEGWQVEAAHFAERHRLVIIVALGESIVALGVGAAGLGIHAAVIVGSLRSASSNRASACRRSASVLLRSRSFHPRCTGSSGSG